jgi:hypothetical protein
MIPYNLLGVPQQLPIGAVTPFSTPTSGPGFLPQQNATAPQQNVQGLIGQTMSNNAQQNQQNFLNGDLKQLFPSAGSSNAGLMSTILGLFGA